MLLLFPSFSRFPCAGPLIPCFRLVIIVSRPVSRRIWAQKRTMSPSDLVSSHKIAYISNILVIDRAEGGKCLERVSVTALFRKASHVIRGDESTTILRKRPKE